MDNEQILKLVKLRVREAEAEPELTPVIMVRQPGLDDRAAEVVRSAFPGIHSSYIDTARALALRELEMGYFRFHPGRAGEPILNALVRNNAPDYHP